MRANEIIASSAFEPDKLELIFEAFDRAWDSIRGTRTPALAEEVRITLALAVLVAASRDCSSVEAILAGALKELGLAPRP